MDIQILKTKLGESIEIDEKATPVTVKVKPTELLKAVSLLKNETDLLFDSLMCLSGIDYPALPTGKAGNFTVVYHLFSTRHNHKLTLKVETAKDNPVVPSVAGIWKTAHWHEREAYDLFGIKFAGHPDLRRILLPDDWVGYPLRKDYQYPTEYHGVPHNAK